MRGHVLTVFLQELGRELLPGRGLGVMALLWSNRRAVNSSSIGGRVPTISPTTSPNTTLPRTTALCARNTSSNSLTDRRRKFRGRMERRGCLIYSALVDFHATPRPSFNHDHSFLKKSSKTRSPQVVLILRPPLLVILTQSALSHSKPLRTS
jgi:hypothetical protein